jgi:crotonobetainyl-CoA:carnitine CoA-transferase CaiB-like acyl-CoA transferase
MKSSNIQEPALTESPTAFKPGALTGVRVIDLSRVLGGPYCGQILADHGADVLKIEPPQGDETRTWGPPFENGVASYYMGLNRNKRGMRMDLNQAADREQLMQMLSDADVLLENFKTGTLEKWGLGFDTLQEKFPRLVHCRVSGYGATGPLGGLPGYDAAIQALSGIMSVNGEVGSEPLRVGLPVVDMVTGLNAVIGVLLALQESQRSGVGQFVEVSLYDCGLTLLHPHAANWFGDGRVPGRTGNAHPNIYPYDAFPTATVPVFLAVGNDRQFQQLCAVLGCPEWAQDARFAMASERSIHRAVLREQLISRMADRDGQALVEQLSEKGVPCAPILDVPQALNHPHTAHRGMRVSLPGGYQGLASPIQLSRTPASYRLPPPSDC